MMLVFTSCSRIVSVDYPLLDKGTVQSVDRNNCQITVVSNRDSMYRVWTPETYMDGLSVRGIGYTDSFTVGDVCYVYDGGDKPIVSKVSISDAKKINAALCEHFNKNSIPSLQAVAFVLFSAFVIPFFWLAFKQDKRACFFVLLVTFVLASFLYFPGRTLETVDSGTITAIEQNRYILDGKRVYYASSEQDIFNGGKLSDGMAVTVYCYGDKHMRNEVFLSRSSFSETLLKMPQPYPEIMLRSIVLYGMSLLAVATLFYLVSLTGKRKENKTEEVKASC